MQTKPPAGYSTRLARRVEKAITASGISLTALSESTDISRETLRRRLKFTESKSFTGPEVALIAWALGLQPGDLMPPLAAESSS